MRLLFTVQRYHADLVGGSEAACRGYAQHLAACGHEVTVVTSCSTSHHDWSNSLPQGTSIENGVTIVRLPTAHSRTEANFGRIHRRVQSGSRLMAWEQALWSQRIGPDLVGYDEWLVTNAERFDAAVVMTYMYPTSAAALRLLPQRIPTVFVPTAHDEPAFRLSSMFAAFHQPHAFGFLTPEEESLVRSWHRVQQPSEVVGVGLDEADVGTDYAAVRRNLGLGGDPYVVCIGRVDVGKGTHDLLSMFAAFKQEHPSALELVLVGEDPSASSPDVTALGFLSDSEKHAVVDGAIALIQPSFVESFSIVLCEAWNHGVPALVNRLCNVTSGQVSRSRGGLSFGTFAEFDFALTALLANPAMRREMGLSGKRFVHEQYSWASVGDRLMAAISHAERSFGKSRRVSEGLA